MENLRKFQGEIKENKTILLTRKNASIMFQPIPLTQSRSRLKTNLVNVTIRNKGVKRSQNSSDIMLSTIILDDNNPPLYFQVGYLGNALAFQLSHRLSENCAKITRSKSDKTKDYTSYSISSQSACLAIFKHFNEEPPQIEDQVITLIIKADAVPNVPGLYTLSMVRKEIK